jgi:hypothetical protein
MEHSHEKELGNDPLCLLDIDELAYQALPEPYKNDRSLNFFLDNCDNVCAEHTLHNEEYVFWMGSWVRIK